MFKKVGMGALGLQFGIVLSYSRRFKLSLVDVHPQSIKPQFGHLVPSNAPPGQYDEAARVLHWLLM